MSGAEPYYADDMVTVHLGDCLDVLAGMEAESIDAVVTDPPYGLEFMGKDWDAPWHESGINADAGFEPTGFTDGGRRLPRPTFTGSTNPPCLNCGGSRRGRRDGTALRKVCTCEAPRFPNVRATEMRAFQDWCEQWAAECLRVLKPGGYIAAFGGTRTWHRLACAIEDAGFEYRDTVADLTGIDGPGLLWIQGSGFPKSVDIAKAIDKAAGAEREVTAEGAPLKRMIPGAGQNRTGSWVKDSGREFVPQATLPATEDAARWQGFGTSLKPAWEPVVVGRKPLVGPVAQNVLQFGTGALNIDGCRVDSLVLDSERRTSVGGVGCNNGIYGDQGWSRKAEIERGERHNPAGRWPPNVLLGEEAAAELDRQSGKAGAFAPVRGSEPSAVAKDAYGQRGRVPGAFHGDEGGASRFFPVFKYEPKAGSAERPRLDDGTAHVTVKPVDLIRWLARLVTPPGGVVLDPFAGSGTTGEACIVEGFRSVLVERDPKYAELIMTRLRKPIQPDLFGALDFTEGDPAA